LLPLLVLVVLPSQPFVLPLVRHLRAWAGLLRLGLLWLLLLLELGFRWMLLVPASMQAPATEALPPPLSPLCDLFVPWLM
jgi:hypothetical protein